MSAAAYLRWSCRLYDAGLLLLLLFLPILWLRGVVVLDWGGVHIGMHWGRRALLAFLAVVALRILLAQALRRNGVAAVGLWKSRPFPQFVMSLCSIYFMFGAAETILAWSGYSANLPPVVFQDKDDAGGLIIEETLQDPELLWKFKPNHTFQGRPINSLGFREREVNPRKTSGVRRVICMGDSVTAQGRPGYAQYLHDQLTAQPPTPGTWEAFNVGVHGYCVLQGLRQFEQLDPLLDPDVVTIYFGWNDHWLDRDPMSQRMAVRMGHWSGRLYELLRQKRSFMLLVAALQPARSLAPNVSEERVFRVPPEEYRWALSTFIDRIRASDAVPLVITAPRSELTEELFRKTYVRTVEEGEKTHDLYVDITRDVARAKGAPLLDLAAVLRGPENAKLFAPDGIHFDQYSREGRMTNDPPAQPGLERIATELHRYLLELGRQGVLP